MKLSEWYEDAYINACKKCDDDFLTDRVDECPRFEPIPKFIKKLREEKD